MPVTEKTPPSLTPQRLLRIALIVQLISIPYLWGHTSATADVLGRYSPRYGVVLAACMAISLSWLIAYGWRGRWLPWLMQRPAAQIIAVLCVVGAGAVVVVLLPVEGVLKHYALLNALLLLALGAAILPDGQVRYWRWRVAYGVGVIIMLALLLITALSAQPYSPDEAHWADYATTPYVADGLYARTWRDEPILIRPGIGWSVAAYGALLQHVAFDMRVGRLWEFSMNLLIVLGVAGVAYQLSGRAAALVGAGVALTTVVFVSLDYRPDTQVVPVALLALSLLLSASKRTEPHHSSAFAIGLLLTLAMQLHAIAIVYAAAFSLYFAGYGLRALLKKQRHQQIYTMAFITGALLGTLCVFLFNIWPIGGLDVYLGELIRTRSATTRQLNFLNWSLLHGVLVLLGLVYLMWRRSPTDKLYLLLVAFILLSSLIFDTQGYSLQYWALLLPPIGVVLVEVWQNRRAVWVSAGVLCALGLLYATTHIHWNGVSHLMRTGTLPEPENHVLAASVLPYVRPDDVIASTHELIWRLQDHPGLTSFAAEQNAQRYLSVDDPAQVWDVIAPTIIIEMPQRIELTPGLRTYMQREGFVPCTQYTVIGIRVTVSRQGCPAEAAAPQVLPA